MFASIKNFFGFTENDELDLSDISDLESDSGSEISSLGDISDLEVEEESKIEFDGEKSPEPVLIKKVRPARPLVKILKPKKQPTPQRAQTPPPPPTPLPKIPSNKS